MTAEVVAKLKVVQGDITRIEVDAIVNAANTRLLGGGGVDGAIHRAAGPELLEECRRIGGCPTGEARLTRGYRLPARFVIHTVGPVYSGRSADSRLLAACYRNSLALAVQHGVRSIAFPAISCGVYGYPINEASRIAVDTAAWFVSENMAAVEAVFFVLFSDNDAACYREYLAFCRRGAATSPKEMPHPPGRMT